MLPLRGGCEEEGAVRADTSAPVAPPLRFRWSFTGRPEKGHREATRSLTIDVHSITFSPTGLSVNDPAHVFHKAVLQEILSGSHARIGDAILAAQDDYAQTGAFPELLSIYHLLGDPALRVR
jgi:Peptidase family C25